MPNDPDVLFRAEVDDATIEFFDRFDRNVDRLAQTTEQGFRRVDERIGSAGKEIGILGGLVGGVTAKLVSMGLQAISSLKQFVEGSVNLRARVDTLGVTLDLVGKRMGFTAEQIAAAEEEVKSMGITTSAARQSLIRLARANIDWADASKIARVAQDSAVVAGLNSSQAFERIILGVQKLNPELLDELGLQISLSQAYTKRARELGISTKELSINEKQQALLNEVFRQSEVVAGSYEAAMGSVGKQMTSLPRHIEELQLAIGGAFQPALQQQVQFMTERLKELRKWFDENEEAVTRFGLQLGQVVESTFKVLDWVIKRIASFPQQVQNIGVAIAETLNGMFGLMSDDQMQANIDGIAEAWKQLVIIIVAGAATSIESVTRMVGIILRGLEVIGAAIAGEDVKASVDKFNAYMAEFSDGVIQAAHDAVEAALDFVYAKDLIAGAANELSVEPIQPFDGDQTQAEANKTVDAIRQVNEALRQLHKRQVRAAEDTAIRRARQDIEEQMRISWQIEDMERQHGERLSQIRRDYQKDMAELADDAIERRLELDEERNKKELEMEERFQQNLHDLQNRFEYQAEELARARDAVGLLRLMRSHEQQLEEERTRRDRAREEAREDYEERLAELEKSLKEQEANIKESFAEQIKAAEEARKKQYEAFERSLARQREIQELHRQWEDEDRARAYQRELEDMAENFAQMEGLTEESLGEILAIWEAHLGDLSAVMEEYRALQAESAHFETSLRFMSGVSLGQAAGYGRGFRSERNPYGYIPTEDLQGFGGDPYAPYRRYTPIPGGTGPHASPGGGNIGQAGQVTELLANALGSSLFQGTPQVPVVTPRASNDQRTITVKADVAGMDARMQRVLVNGLLEIERNRGT